MNLTDLVAHATDKERFLTVDNYIIFCAIELRSPVLRKLLRATR